MSRDHYNTWTRIKAVLTSPSLYQLAAEVDYQPPVGKRRDNPTYVVLAYGVLARLTRSGIRVELDLHEPHAWAAVRQQMIATITTTAPTTAPISLPSGAGAGGAGAWMSSTASACALEPWPNCMIVQPASDISATCGESRRFRSSCSTTPR